jgi:hypothetical protein
METTRFLSSILGDDGAYCLFFITPAKKRVQKFYPTIERLVAASQEAAATDADVYFALATFKDTSSREADNALQLRSLFLDMDCGPAKDYPSQSDAVQALREFVQTMGLPRPMLVNSGRGVHAYWPLNEPVTRAEWQPVADALKRACAAKGFRTDTAVTNDAARVLRMPGTENHKDAPPTPVTFMTHTAGASDLSDLAALLSGYAERITPEDPDAAALKGVLMSMGDDPVMQRLLRNRTASFRKIMQRGDAGCRQLVSIMLNQADTPEPLWRAGLSIAKHCEDGRKAAVKMSEQHPMYDPEELQEKFDRVDHPYSCKKFDELNPGGCEGCPFLGKIGTPLRLGEDIAEAADPVEPEDTEEDADDEAEEDVIGAARPTSAKSAIPTKLPWPYFRGAQGGVYTKLEQEDGTVDKVMVYSNDLYFTQRVLDQEAGECILGRVHLPNDKAREFVLPLTAATAKEELRKILSANGVTVPTKRWEALMAYTHAWIENLQTTTVADTARRQFGWVDEEMTCYVIGEREIFADRVGYNPPATATAFLFPAMRKAGTLEGWVEQANFYNRPNLEPYQFVVCQAMAAPLMRLTAVNASIFDLYSDGSGHGKSTTQAFAATIYGRPSDLIMGPKDTLNARLNRLEIMKDVNVQFDEFTEFPAEDTSSLIYEITSGRQKARMSSGSNAERYRGDAWKTTVTSSSNHSMLAKVYATKANPRAEVQRVLRYHVMPHNFTDKSETDRFSKSVGENRGHAVEVFVQYVMRNKETVKTLLETVQRKLDKACGLTHHNRFWSVQGAVTITALICARECGLLSYDVKTLFDWVTKLIVDNKTADMDAVAPIETIINDYVNEHYGNILWIKSTADLRGVHNSPGLDQLVVPEMQPKTKLVARYETDLKRLYLVPKAFRHWCARQKMNPDSVMAEAALKFRGEYRRMRLGKGTKLQLPATLTLVLDCDTLDLPEVPDAGGEGG